MLTTSQLRLAFAPACTPINDDVLIPAYEELDRIFQRYNYRPRAGVTGAYNCRAITGGSGYSLHSYRRGRQFTFFTGVKVTPAVACDVNWDKNPYGPRLVTDMPRAMVDEIEAVRTRSGAQVWQWGGYFSGNKDAMHWQITCRRSDLQSGIIPDAASTPRPAPPAIEEDDMQWQYVIDRRKKPDGSAVDPAGKVMLAAHGFTPWHVESFADTEELLGNQGAKIAVVNNPADFEEIQDGQGTKRQVRTIASNRAASYYGLTA